MNTKAINGFVTRVLTDGDNTNSIQLWRRQEGFDVVVIRNNDVFSVKFFSQYDRAEAHYNELKQQIFNTKEEK